MSYVELVLDTWENKLLYIEQKLEQLGALTVTTVTTDEFSQQTKVNALFKSSINKKALESALTGVKYHWNYVNEQNWQNFWREHFKPIKINDNFWVVPSWTQTPKPDVKNLIIEPNMAFDVCIHSSTCVCLQQLLDLELTQKTVLDFGCDAGILGISALMHAAKHVTFTDTNPDALASTKNNCLQNGLNPYSYNIELVKNINKTYDIVIVNALAINFIKSKATLTSYLHSNSIVLLIGFLPEQLNPIMAAYPELDFNLKIKDNARVLIGSYK